MRTRRSWPTTPDRDAATPGAATAEVSQELLSPNKRKVRATNSGQTQGEQEAHTGRSPSATNQPQDPYRKVVLQCRSYRATRPTEGGSGLRMSGSSWPEPTCAGWKLSGLRKRPSTGMHGLSTGAAGSSTRPGGGQHDPAVLDHGPVRD